jgi:hypothetical protein
MSARHANLSYLPGWRAVLAAALILCPVSFAGDGDTPPPPAHTLCQGQESVVFSCTTTGGKIASLCASPNLSHDAGYLQYRYGRAPDSIELQFPRTTEHQGGVFKYLQQYFAKGGTTALSFWVGRYRYSIFRTTSAFGFNGAGVIVSHAEHRVAYMRCEDKTIVTDDDRLANLPNLGLPEANGDISYVGSEQ